MSRHPGEDALSWFERAIVVNRLAQDQLTSMQEAATPYNHAADTSIRRTADRAAQDVADAQRAYQIESAADPRSSVPNTIFARP